MGSYTVSHWLTVRIEGTQTPTTLSLIAVVALLLAFYTELELHDRSKLPARLLVIGHWAKFPTLHITNILQNALSTSCEFFGLVAKHPPLNIY